jgi:hypothetical protein
MYYFSIIVFLQSFFIYSLHIYIYIFFSIHNSKYLHDADSIPIG